MCRPRNQAFHFILGEKGRDIEKKFWNSEESLLLLVQFHVPVQIIPPAQRRIFYADSQRDDRHPAGFYRLSNEAHSRFVRCSASLSVVAGKAGSDNIFPGSLPSLDLRSHMIERQVFGRIFYPAILTGIFISLINVGAGESTSLLARRTFTSLRRRRMEGSLKVMDTPRMSRS